MAKHLQPQPRLLALLIALSMGALGIPNLFAQNTLPEGALSHVFSVAEGSYVFFSQGNLQYIGSASTPFWRFADHQWDYLGTTTGQNSSNENVDRDLFGWGTSGYNHGAIAYQPWSTSITNSQYYAYGSSSYNLFDQTGQADWGYNAIFNGGNTENNGWRTLTSNEWGYLFDTRSTISGIRYAKATVNNVNGVILLPDDWSTSYYTLNNTNSTNANYTSNTITASQWNTLEQHGAVFLPAAGRRDGMEVVDGSGFYWSASYDSSSSNYVCYLYFYSDGLFSQCNGGGRIHGKSVRLVASAENCSYGINATPNPAEGGTVSGGGAYTLGANCTLTATPSAGYAFFCWVENEVVVSTEATYTFTVCGERNLIACFTQPGNITFADANVKSLCVANWDINNDGELSYAEAAAVTDLGQVFKSNYTITSFDELQYFTGLTSIGEQAFIVCSSLASIVIPNSVTSIRFAAFYGCSDLTSVTIPNSVTEIGEQAFIGCSGLTGELIIPNSVTLIGNRAFSNCSGLTSLTIGNSVTSIGERAFYYCSSLISMTIGNSVTSIGQRAFEGCSGLTSITSFAVNPPTVGSSAFLNVPYSATIHVPCGATANYIIASGWNRWSESNYEEFDDGYYCPILFADANVKAICVAHWDTDGNGELSYAEAAAVTNLNTNFIFDENITSFNELQYFTSLTSLGTEEFLLCTNLASITLPKSLVAIGSDAFAGCDALVSITRQATVPPTVATGAFDDVATATLIVPCGHTSLYQAASGWDGFAQYEEYDAGDNCVIVFADANVKALCVAHWDTDGNGELSYAEAAAVTDLGQVFNANTTITSFDELQYFTSLTSIGEQTFSGCTSLTSVVIPNSVTSIGLYAFNNCSGLTSLTIGNSVTSIGLYAFNNCSGLIGELTIPNSVTSIGNSSFSNCSGLTSVTIGNSVTSIGHYAFNNCSGLTSVTIPNSMTSIGSSAFDGCVGLTSVNYTGNIAQWCGIIFTGHASNPLCYGHNLYIDNELVTDLTIPDSMTSIKQYTFEGCSSLSSVTIPNSVTSIETAAFSGCSELYSITVLSETPASVGTDAFVGLPVTATVYVPCGTIADYQAANGWNAFLNYSEIITETCAIVFADDAVKAICVANWDTNGDGELSYLEAAAVTDLGSVFKSNTTITSFDELQYFDVLTAIPNTAFQGCSSLVSIALPASLTNIGNGSFYNCTSLALLIVLAETPPTLGSQAFRNVPTTIPVYIPCDSYAAYQNQSWGGFTNFVCYDIHIITAAAEPAEGGTVTGAGQYLEAATCTLTATANPGYTFTNWTRDGIVVSTESSYTFTVTGDAAFVANFTANSYNITATASPTNGGSVTGGGTYNYGASCTLTATPATGYTFTNWTENGEEVSTEATYSFVVSRERNLVANFVASSGPEPIDYSQEYFTITSWEPNNTITFHRGIEYFEMYISYDKINWTLFTSSSNTNSTVVLGVGEKAYFKATTYQLGTDDYGADCNFSATKLFEASGNIMSLINGDDFVGATSFYPTNDTYSYNFIGLFEDATTLLTIENLVLPATQYNKWVYQSFARGCTSLIRAPKELPAQTYQGQNTLVWMFSNCPKLQESPVIRLTSNASGDGWFQMFKECSSLKKVICLMEGTDLDVTGVAWLYGVASDGVFYKKSSSTWQSGNTAIPSSWITRDWSEDPTDFVKVTSTPAFRYSCYVEGTSDYYEVGDMVTLKCTPLNGYAFNGWYVNGALVSTSDTYSFTATQNIEVTPSFETWVYENQYFTIESLEDDNTITLTIGAEVTQDQLQSIAYSTDNGATWNTTSIDNTEQVISVNLNAGGKVLWKGTGVSMALGYNDNQYSFFNSTKQFNVLGNIMSLLFGDGFASQTVLQTVFPDESIYTFSRLFDGCAQLISAENLILPASIMVQSCYFSMFQDCTSLTQVPGLPATTLAENCYSNMFSGCTSLTQVPELPATSLANGCYSYMFSTCTSLVQAPELPATTLANGCYEGLFNYCTSLTQVPELPATSLAESCYSGMFYGCTSLVQAPELPATSLANGCYRDMFYGCTSLAQAPELPATTLSPACYMQMFEGCSSLTQAPELPATTLAVNCYRTMFRGCSSLTQAPELPATTLTDYCYFDMFENCTSLTQAPELPATALASNCYGDMFNHCISLTQAPELPAVVMEEWCYASMFFKCTSLTQAPELPATVLASHCYFNMFSRCTSLTHAPELPATTLTDYCYSDMFENCTSLTQAPELPAVTLAYRCYRFMFEGCSLLNEVTCWATDISAIDCTNDWLSGVSPTGTFHKNVLMEDWQSNSSSGIPSGWNVEDLTKTINITVAADPVIGGNVSGAGEYQYGALSTLTLTAIPNEGFMFLYWTKDDQIVSTEQAFSFTIVESGEYVAHFKSACQIGDGSTTTNQYLPSFSHYNYSLSQQIYTAEEIGRTGNINSLSFFNTGGEKTRSYDIYLVHTEKTAFDGTQDWISVTETDRVFSGTVTMRSGDWTEIAFDTPFAYNGTSNLAIIMDDNSGNWTGSPFMTCRVFETQDSQAIRVYNDDINYNPMAPSSYIGTLHTVKNQIMFGFIVEAQTAELPQGWSWYAPTVKTSIETIQTTLGDNLLQIKAQDGTPSGNVVAGKMYRIQTGEACTLLVTGAPFTTATVTINQGENWFGYFGTEKTVGAVFNATFGPTAGDKVVSQNGGFAIYNGSAWQGTLTTLLPGQGYVYVSQSNETKTLVME